MKKSQMYIILALAAVVAISGCVGQPQTPARTTGGAFVGGSQGLVTTFQPGLPPEELFESQTGQTVQTQQVMLQVTNAGEKTVKSHINIDTPAQNEVVVCLGGPTEFNIDAIGNKPGTNDKYASLDNLDELLGARKVQDNVVPGGTDVISFEIDTPEVAGDTPVTISATTKYTYETKGISTLCMPQNLLSQTAGAAICEPTGSKPVSSSGAPIQISGLTQIATTSNNKVNLVVQFMLNNVGGGTVYADNTEFTNGCDAKDAFSKVNRALVTATIGGKTMTCNSGQRVAFSNNQAQVTCVLSSSGTTNTLDAGSRDEILNVDVDYQYLGVVSKPLIIRNIQ